jgi:hypothetical protein
MSGKRAVADVVECRDSYKNVFEVLVGGSNILNNITNGLADAVGL